jgi:PAS domain S-box-containing protein
MGNRRALARPGKPPPRGPIASSEHLLALAERMSAVGYWRLDLATGSVTWSDQVYRIHGVTRETYDPDLRSVIDFYHPDDRATVEGGIDRASRNGGSFEFEIRLIRADGSVRAVVSRGERETDDDGKPTALIGVLQDVTQIRQGDAALREHAERLARIIERLPVGAIHAREGVLSMNAEAERITGYSRHELPTLESWFRIIYDDASGKLLSRYYAVREAGFPDAVRGAVRRKDGGTRTVEFRACGDAIGELWILYDVTERKAIEDELIEAKERAEAAARFKSEFLANMSHEIRTPLTAIIGFTGLLNDQGELSDREQRWLSRIDDASKALLSIVNDVLDFSKLEDGGIELNHEAFGLRSLVSGTVDLLTDQAARKDVVLTTTVADDIPDRLSGDPDRLRQVLLNLVSNGVKFTAQGKVGIRVAAVSHAPLRLRFEVADSGIGVPDDAKAHIFRRFAQADGSISRKFGGTGLGLAICKRLVEAMDGEIGLDSRLGQGSTFHFEVPLPEAVDSVVCGYEDATLDGGALKILLVEDAEPNQELIRTLLGAVNIDVDIASNGLEAVEAVKVNAYDLVLMDVQMPVLDGVQATRIIRGLGGAFADLPIIALSANVLADQVADYRLAGMNAHLAKPINPAEMLQAIAQWANAPRESANAPALARGGQPA